MVELRGWERNEREDDDGEWLGAGDAVAATGVRLSADQRRLGFVVAGVAVGGAGIGVSLWRGTYPPGAAAELVVLAILAVGSGLVLTFVTRNPAGATVVINPGVCFTFAILLTWGLLPAVTTTVAAVAALTIRRRLPALRGLLLVVQVAAALAAAYGALNFDRAGPSGRAWTSVQDATVVIASTAAWLGAYAAVGYLLVWIYPRRLVAQIPRPTGNEMLFNAALVVLSPVVGVAADNNIVLAALVLVPLYATQRMARLSAEKERAERLDPLTSLANRTMLHEDFDRLAADSDRSGRTSDEVALVLLDLDRFKQVNDSLGHEVGDHLLTAAASRLTSIDIGQGTVARVSADEFALLAHLPPTASAADLAERAMRALRGPISLDGIVVDVTASAGLATRTAQSGDDFETVVRHADIAMYDSKRHGDMIAAYRHQADQASPERLQLLTDFRQALLTEDTVELSMHYQPQVSIASGAVDGLEALLRWTHPVYGFIDATWILGIAEHTAVMQLLTAHVIDSVTAQLVAWRHDGLTPRVSVNVSARDLYGDDLVNRLRDRVDQYHIPPHTFQVEVTESALIADPSRAGTTLRAIADLGVDIALDDFGTGYSSLQNLRHIPLHEIKIDQAFVAGMTDNRHDAAIVASTVNLAHALELRAVAEGVANEQTRMLLTDLGCDLGQGWYFSRAVPAEAVPNLISQNLAAD